MLRNDLCDKHMIGHIEGGVIDLYSLGHHALAVPHFGDFEGCSIWMSASVAGT